MAKCPTHNVSLIPRHTGAGIRWFCPQPWCTVEGTGAENAVPKDTQTRQLVHQCHLLFDPLWQKSGVGFGGNRAAERRDRAYRWLAHEMAMPIEQAHFGRFSKDQLLKAIEKIEKFIAQKNRR